MHKLANGIIIIAPVMCPHGVTDALVEVVNTCLQAASGRNPLKFDFFTSYISLEISFTDNDKFGS